MRSTRHKKIMKLLYEQFNGNYVDILIWVRGSKAYGDGTYNYKLKTEREKCSNCGK